MSTAATTDAEPEDFEQTSEGWAKRWETELDAALKAQEAWRTQGDKVVRIYLDERDAGDETATHWNLYHSGVQVLLSMLYGNVPKANVSRRFADSEDDAARVAGEMAERLLHSDIEKRSDTAREAFGNALLDWLNPGLGTVRVRYSMREEKVPGKPAKQRDGKPVPGTEVPEAPKRTDEQALVDYVHWKDFVYSPCRVWSEVAWVGFYADMPKAPFVERFGEEAWAEVPKQSSREKDEEKEKDPWARVRVCELWHRGEGKVFWWVKGYGKCLDIKDDPLQLDGFWPCPSPLMANVTTTKLVPKPDYYFAQDLYLEINRVSTRIDKLQKAIKVVGTYDKANEELKKVLEETCDLEMIPSENWGGLQEKGGLKGAMQFLPLGEVIEALMALRDYRRELVDALYQVTGQADIMRGQATTSGASATEQAVKAKFGSVRVQRRQDEVARFVSEAQALKLEVVCKHFLPESILERSNARYAFKSEKPEVVQAAVQLLKSEYHCYRVEVKPESVSLTDFSQLKADRTELLGGLSQFVTAMAPIAESMPNAMPHLLKLLQAAVAGMRGSSTMEGILDAAVEDAEKAQEAAAANPQPQQEDPKVTAQRMKMQGDAMKAQADTQKEQMKLQGDLTRIQAETEAHATQERVQREENVREAGEKQLTLNALKPPTPQVSYRPKPGGAR